MSAETKVLGKTAQQAQPSTEQLAPGVTVEVRDEHWLVTGVARTKDGFRVRVRGLSDYVRDTTATFFTALDRIEVLDPTKVDVIPDDSPRYRHARLWVESTLRQTAVPLHQQELEVSTRMLADPLDYQLAAVHKALSPDNVRPRILLADAVGLGKTLEIGMILAELIRRGRGERILVVTPKHVMEQFQQELWTRFAIPLVRLDSVGIQKVRQKLPASRNPFTYFPRVIVSMDTLKSPKYRAQLNKVRWDAVVIDEIHNATNVGTQNNELARTLAPTTDALILIRRGVPLFDHAIVDEAQDFHAGHWRFLRAAVRKGPNDIFIAEDSHQRIYGQHLTMSHFDITIRGRASRKLTRNYRTTHETLNYAMKILEGEEWRDSSDEEDTTTGYRSLRNGPEPIVVHAATEAEQMDAVIAQLHKWQDSAQGELNFGILVRSRADVRRVTAALTSAGFDATVTRQATVAAEHDISVMTMHSAKGLEFTHVVLLGVNAQSMPQAFRLNGLAEAERDDVLQRERALLYVAASRARDALMITAVGEASELLPAE